MDKILSKPINMKKAEKNINAAITLDAINEGRFIAKDSTTVGYTNIAELKAVLENNDEEE